jgi:hypothetical protein
LFVHWSNQQASYRDMESRGMHCSRCNKDTQHTFRYHITKTKHYSVVSVGSGKKEITVVCHVCLLETSIEKKDSKELVKQYDNEIAVGEANELLDKEKYSKAERKLRKVLNKDPEFPQALYSISKCLISQAKYDEAEYQIRILENKFPDIPEIKELRDSLPPKLGTVEPKQAEVKPDETAKPKPTLPKGSTPKPVEISSAAKHSNENSEKICNDCYHEETLHVSTNYHESQGLVEGECIGCKKDGLTVICKELFETSSNDKQATSDNEDIEIATTSHIIEKKSALEKMNEEEVVEYLKLIEELQKVGLGNSNNLIEVKQMLVKDRGLDENNLQYLTELDVQLDKQVNEITKSVEKSEKDREERQKELDDLKKMEAEDKLEESKMQVKQSELELKEKKEKKEETRNKMKEDKKLEESKRQLEVAERELEEKKKKKEETRKQREIDKQIAINEEKIKKIEEESKKLDEES